MVKGETMMRISITNSSNISYLHGCGIIDLYNDIYMFSGGFFKRATDEVIIGYSLYKEHKGKGEVPPIILNQLKGQIINAIRQSEEKEYREDFINKLINEQIYEIDLISL